MIPSAMIQKYCMLIFLLMTWNQCIFSNKDTYPLDVWLGCRVLIPCRRLGTLWDSFRWVYKEDEHSKATQLYFLDRSGLTRYAHNRRANVLNNGSLIIDDFKETDQGVYWCENCDKEVKCGSDQSDIFRVQKETLTEIQRISYTTAGSSFTQSCLGVFPDLKWTFEASAKTDQESKQIPETTIHIVKVKTADAGRYTCWASRCGGPSQKLLTVNLCVVEVRHSENSSLSCFMTCDVDSKSIEKTSSLQMDNTIISVAVDPSGAFVCEADQILDSSTTVTSTHTSKSAVLNTTAGESEETENTFPAIYGLSIIAACLALTALVIFCFKSRLQAAFPFHSSCCGFGSKEEEDATVIYSSLVFKAPPARRHGYASETECIYGEIKV